MAPTILLGSDGGVELVAGSPGGSTIITTVFQTVVNVYDFQMSPQQAVDAARFHHQLLPPTLVTYDPSLPASTLTALRTMGYDVVPHPWPLGDAQLLVKSRGAWTAAADRRGRGVARVLEGSAAAAR